MADTETQLDIEPEIDEPVVEAPDPEQIEAESEAKKYGWKPKESFDLAPDGWVDAKRFLELPSTQNKALRDAKRDLERRLDEEREARQAENNGIRAASKAAVDAVRQQEQERYRNDLAAIQQRQREAVGMADTQRFDALEKQKQQLRPPAPVWNEPPPNPPSNPAQDPVVIDYIAKNEWAQDDALRQEGAWAIDAARNGGRTFKGLADQLAYAESVMKRKYPHMFQQAAPTRPTQSRVDGGGLGGSARRAKGADDLPAADRAIGKEFVAEGVFKTLDDYAKAYFEQDK